VIEIEIVDDIELCPSLAHCIETTTREEYWNLVNQYMKSLHEDRKLEEKIELLRAFLESADFRRLRSRSERYLVQGKKVKFVISWRDNKASYEMVVTKATD
jgi:hypothetical protein